MLAPLPAGIDVTVHHRTPAGRDSRGNDTFTTTSATYSGCGWWPGTAGRNVSGSRVYGESDFRNSVTTRSQVLLPDGAVVSPGDPVDVLGVTWRASGEGRQWGSQLTGVSTGVQVDLERTDG